MPHSRSARVRAAVILLAAAALVAALFAARRSTPEAPLEAKALTPQTVAFTAPASTEKRRIAAALKGGASAPQPRANAQARQRTATPADHAPVATAKGKPRFRKRQVIVKFKPSASQAERAALRASVGGTVVDRYASIGAERLVLARGQRTLAAVRKLERSAAVEYAQPNGIAYIASVPNDPGFPQQWALNNTGPATQFANSEADADIDAPEAWDTQTGGPDVTVAVIDTGLQLDHPDLVDNLWTNPNEVANGADDDTNVYKDDLHGVNVVTGSGDPSPIGAHGTHVAGIIGAEGGNGIGISGVSQHVKLMPIQAFQPADDTFAIDNNHAVKAVEYALSKGVDVINGSYAGYAANWPALQDLIQSPAAADTTFVYAAGNDGVNVDVSPTTPCTMPSANVICVGATDPADRLAYFSNYGETNVDLMAPGHTIYSTLPNSSYGFASGTSMAAPQVAGAVAVLKSANPTWSPSTIKARLLATTDPVVGLRTSVSNGRLNLAQALSGTVPPSTATALVGISSGKVSYVANNGALNVVEVLRNGSGSLYTVEDARATLTPYGGCASVTPRKVQCPSASVTGISVSTADRADFISAPVTLPVTVNAGTGNDVINTGSGNDQINAGFDHDTIRPGDGNDTVDGNAGDDWTDNAAGGGNDVIHGGSGDDSLNGGDGIDQVYGDDGADVINVGEHTSGVELADGGAGDDQLWSKLGDDSFVGGPGSDSVVYGHRGTTTPVTATLGGTTGNGAAGENDAIASDIEQLNGGDGNDVLTGDGNDNRIEGGLGDDVLRGMGGDDTLSDVGSRYVDGVQDWGADDFSGGAGANDRVVYPRGIGYQNGSVDHEYPIVASLDGLANDGAVSGGEHDLIRTDVESLEGGEANDTLIGNAGANTLAGGSGDDTLIGGGGTDTYDGGRRFTPGCNPSDSYCNAPGSDTVSYDDKTATVTASFDGVANDGVAGENENLPDSIEKVVGSSQNDTLSSVAATPKILQGGLGLDTYTGGDGDETILERDGVTDGTTACGGGTDEVKADAFDPAVMAGCENVDRQPAARITGGVSENRLTNDSTPTFTFDAPYSTGVTFKCKVESGTEPGAAEPATCESPWTASTVADGPAVLSVQAFTGSAPNGPVALRHFKVDTAAPETAYTEAAQVSSTSTTARFVLESPESNGRFQCKLDGGEFVPCAYEKTYTGLSDGPHTFSGRAVDDAGNVDASPMTTTWTINPPDTTITGGPAIGANVENPSQTFTFASTKSGTFECRVDSGTWTTCASPKTQTFSQGPHLYSVRAVDSFGGIDPTPAQAFFTVVAQSFNTTITGGPSSTTWTSNTTPTFTFSSTPSTGYTFECQVGPTSAPWTTCSSPYTTPPITATGAVPFRVRAVNGSGVPDYTPATKIIYLDTAAPDTTLSSAPAQGVTVTTPTATFAFGDPAFTDPAACVPGTLQACSTFECKLDAGSWTPCTTPWTTPVLTPGPRVVQIRAVDPAGNVDPTPVVRGFNAVEADAGAAVSNTSFTPSPALRDWVHWGSATSATTIVRRSTASQLFYGSVVGLGGGTPAPLSSTPVYSWTDAAGASATGSSSWGASTGAGDNRELVTLVDAKADAIQTLKVYVGVRGTAATGSLRVGLNGGRVAIPTTVSGTSDTTIVNRVFTIRYRAETDGDILAVAFRQTSGGTSSASAVVIYGATIS